MLDKKSHSETSYLYLCVGLTFHCSVLMDETKTVTQTQVTSQVFSLTCSGDNSSTQPVFCGSEGLYSHQERTLNSFQTPTWGRYWTSSDKTRSTTEKSRNSSVEYVCEMVLTTRNPKQSQSWRTGNSLLESKTEAIPNVSARKWARGPSKSSLSRKDCLKKQQTGRPSTTGRSKSFDSRQEKCKEAKQTRVQQTGHDALFIMSCLMDTVQANKPRKFNPQTSSSDVSLLLLLETLPWLDWPSQPWKTLPQLKRSQQHVSAPLCFVSCR